MARLMATVTGVALGLLAGVAVSVGGPLGCCAGSGSFDEIPNATFDLTAEDAAALGMDRVTVEIRSSTVRLTGVTADGSVTATFDRAP
jgi:hypothetical protein